MSYALNSPFAVLGELTHLYTKSLSLYFDQRIIETDHLIDQSSTRINSILLARRIPRNTSWRTWYRESATAQEEFERLLPSMDNPSTILIIGHHFSERSRERHKARRFLRTLISGMSSHVRNLYGKETSVNAIELPPSANHQVMIRRLVQFLSAAPLAANNNVIHYEALKDNSIKMSLSAVEI